MANHSSILAWKIPRTEEPSRLQSMGSQKVGHNWVTSGNFILYKFSHPAFFWLLFGMSFHLFIFSLCVFLNLHWVSYRYYVIGFFRNSFSLSMPFIGEFNLFTFNVIINWCVITVVILLTVSVLVVLYISSSLLLLFEVFVVIFKSYLLMGVP